MNANTGPGLRGEARGSGGAPPAGPTPAPWAQCGGCLWLFPPGFLTHPPGRPVGRREGGGVRVCSYTPQTEGFERCELADSWFWSGEVQAQGVVRAALPGKMPKKELSQARPQPRRLVSLPHTMLSLLGACLCPRFVLFCNNTPHLGSGPPSSRVTTF